MDIETLKKMANNKCNWRERLQAVNEMGNLECQPSADILCRLAIHDPVFKVKEAAFRAAQKRNLTFAGKPIKLNRKPKGNLVKDIKKKLMAVKNKCSDECSIEEFKENFQKLYPSVYDTYEGDKGNKFDKWLSNVIQSLPKNK